MRLFYLFKQKKHTRCFQTDLFSLYNTVQNRRFLFLTTSLRVYVLVYVDLKFVLLLWTHVSLLI